MDPLTADDFANAPSDDDDKLLDTQSQSAPAVPAAPAPAAPPPAPAAPRQTVSSGLVKGVQWSLAGDLSKPPPVQAPAPVSAPTAPATSPGASSSAYAGIWSDDSSTPAATPRAAASPASLTNPDASTAIPSLPNPAAQPPPQVAAPVATQPAATPSPTAASAAAPGDDHSDTASLLAALGDSEDPGDAAREQYARDQAANLKYFKSQGGQTQITPTGAEQPATDSSGNQLYKGAVINPFTRLPDGDAYRVSRDQYGNDHYFRIVDGQAGDDFHVDPQTGDKYVSLSGADGGSRREVVGNDPYVPLINATKDALANHQSNYEQASGAVEAAQNGVAGAPGLASVPLDDLRKQQATYNKTYEQAQKTVGIFSDYLNGGNDPLTGPQLDTLRSAQATVAQYQPVVQSLGDEISTRSAAITAARQGRDTVNSARDDTRQLQKQLLAARQDDGSSLQQNLGAVLNGSNIDPNWQRRYLSAGLLTSEQQADGSTAVRVSSAGLSLLGKDVQQSVASQPSQFNLSQDAVQSLPPPQGQPQNTPGATSGIPNLGAATSTSPGQQQPGAGPKSYQVDQQGNVSFDQSQPSASVLAAYKDGAINDDTLKATLPKALALESQSSSGTSAAPSPTGSASNGAAGSLGAATPAGSPTSGASGPAAAAAPSASGTGKPYSIGADGSLQLDPKRIPLGLLAAANDGVISQDQMAQALPQAGRAQQALDQAAQHQATNPGLADQLKAFGGSLVNGITSGIGTIVRSPIGQGVAGILDLPGAAYDLATTGKFDPMRPAKQAATVGNAISNTTSGIVPDALKDTVGAKAGGFLGGVLPYVAEGALAPEALVPTLFASGFQDQYETAKAKLQSDAQAKGQPLDPQHAEDVANGAGLLGGAINTVLGLPLDGAGNAIAKVFGGTGRATIAEGLMNAFQRGGVKAVGEMIGQLDAQGLSQTARDSIGQSLLNYQRAVYSVFSVLVVPL